MTDGGRIIMSGGVADRMPFAGGSVYAMSKAAVAGLTRDDGASDFDIDSLSYFIINVLYVFY